LALEYRPNAAHLDPRIKAVAALGDSVVPLLLEKLQPVQSSGSARNLAANCRRVLEQLDPNGFLDALAELLNSGNETARHEALILLGFAPGPRAVQLLSDVVDTGNPEDRALAISALTKLKAAAAASKVAPLLSSPDRNMREVVLDYLIAAAPAQALDTVLQALSVESEGKLLMLYVDYLAAAVSENDVAAKALLPLLDHDRLDYNDRKKLVAALGKVAPKSHDPSIKRLHALIDAGDVDSLGLQSALTLRTLGDKSGIKKLQNTLSDQLRKSQLKRDSKTYERRANLLLATEDYTEAIDDLEKVIEFSQSALTTRKAQLSLARCEAHKRRWSKVLEYLQKASPTAEELASMVQEDPVMQDAFQQDKIRAFVQSVKDPKDAKDKAR
jgi:tetratricopeptide (TPR) repeat protein